MTMKAISGYGGKSQNRTVNDKGKSIASSAAPKDTRMGKSTSPNATNVIPGTKVTSKELSPTAWPQSRNRGSHYKK